MQIPPADLRSVTHNGGSKQHRGGFSLVEVVISTFLVGMVLVGAMKALGASIRANERTHQSGRAVLLADALISEIQRQDYADDVTPTFGLESDEQGSSDRSNFDDVDDYDDWLASPPQKVDGTVLAGLTGWERSVTISHLDPETLTPLADSNDLGVKQIVVQVSRNGETLAVLQAVTTGASAPLTFTAASSGGAAVPGSGP